MLTLGARAKHAVGWVALRNPSLSTAGRRWVAKGNPSYGLATMGRYNAAWYNSFGCCQIPTHAKFRRVGFSPPSFAMDRARWWAEAHPTMATHRIGVCG